jgi:hypothetical protein
MLGPFLPHRCMLRCKTTKTLLLDDRLAQAYITMSDWPQHQDTSTTFLNGSDVQHQYNIQEHRSLLSCAIKG